MNATVNSVNMSIGEREFLLVDISNSLGSIGITPITARAESEYERNAMQEVFFVGDEPLINVLRTHPTDPFANKMINQYGTMQTCNEVVRGRLASVCENYFTNNQGLLKSVQPIMELLCDGLYVIHEAKMIQSDGAGNFFWGAYSIRHEIYGSSDYNSVIGMENNYPACFMIPTCGASEYSETSVRVPMDKIKRGKRVGGLAFQMAGMFSVLLSGHANATASLLCNAEFQTILIEPIRSMIYESEEEAAMYDRLPMAKALSCPFVKIPMENVPEDMLENFLLRRNEKKPANYDLLISKLKKPIRNSSRRSPTEELYHKAEMLPDCKMIESASAVNSLSEEQIEALLSGEITYNGEVIISNNYYNSVVVACNFLQYADFERFIDFSLNILASADLAATHKYVMERLGNIMNSKVYRFLKSIRDGEMSVYEDILPMIEHYITAYDSIADRVQHESRRTSKIKDAIKEVDKSNVNIGLSKMEAFIKKTKSENKAKE